MDHLKKTLDRFYNEYDFKGRVLHDPVEFPHRYKNPPDIEVSGFIASSFAYGRVELFKAVVGKVLSGMGSGPCDFLLDFDPGKRRKLFKDIRYRFNDSEDIICLLFILRETLRQYSSIKNAFRRFYGRNDKNTGKALSGLVSEFLRVDTTAVYGKDLKPPGLTQFFPSPSDGSACKRANLFLRWMIRDKDIDFGIWKGIPKSKLVIPLDTHIARIARCLGFTERKTQDWKTAVEITESLKKFDPDDPLKYDFALCHHGISGMCKGERRDKGCRGCVFKGIA